MTTFYVLDKRYDVVNTFDNAYDVSVYMLGKSLKHYVIIKSDENGDRLYTIKSGDVFEIKSDLEVI